MEENELVGQFKDNKPTQNIFQRMDEIHDIPPLPIYSVRVPNRWWASNDNNAC